MRRGRGSRPVAGARDRNFRHFGEQVRAWRRFAWNGSWQTSQSGIVSSKGTPPPPRHQPEAIAGDLGHEFIQMTYDLYCYLFDLRDDERDGMQQLGAWLLA